MNGTGIYKRLILELEKFKIGIAAIQETVKNDYRIFELVAEEGKGGLAFLVQTVSG